MGQEKDIERSKDMQSCNPKTRVYNVREIPCGDWEPGDPIGSAGPTTSYRMDSYAPVLMEKGLKGMIGKGLRGPEVIEAMKKFKAVYLAATGGAGALLAQRVKSAEIVAYEDLGPEAIRRLVVEDLPAIVVNDTRGNDLYNEGKKQYKKT